MTEKKSKKSAVTKAVKNRKAMPDNREAECPIEILGTNSGYYYFISLLGEIRRFTETQLNEAALQGLFGGDLTWLQKYFPIKPNSGRAKTGCEFNLPAARKYLIRRCFQKPLFDTSQPQRATGVWRHKASSQPIVHCGNEILINGKWVNAGFKEEGCIYVAAPAIAKPADKPGTTQDSKEILAGFRCWHFEYEHGAEIALGIYGQALIAGALDWKAHALFHGPFASGKSTLMNFFEAALGPACFIPKTDFTEPGLRQDMNNQARACLLDEAENDPGSAENMKRVVKMVRQMSGGRGANIQRGTPGGQALNYRLNSCVMMFCINMPSMEPQDLTRITLLRLLPLTDEQKSGGAEKVQRAIDRAGELSLKIWRRVIDRLGHYRQAFYAFHAYMTGHLKLSARAADQLGAILAGADILLYDFPPEDSDSIAERIEIIRPLIDEWTANENSESEGQLCLNHLYSSAVSLSRDDHKTIGKLILEGLNPDKGEWARETLLQMGLRIENPGTKDAYLLIANRHQALSGFFRGSKWQGGWYNTLRNLPGIEAAGNGISFDGVESRSSLVPFEWLPVEKTGK